MGPWRFFLICKLVNLAISFHYLIFFSFFTQRGFACMCMREKSKPIFHKEQSAFAKRHFQVVCVKGSTTEKREETQNRPKPKKSTACAMHESLLWHCTWYMFAQRYIYIYICSFSNWDYSGILNWGELDNVTWIIADPLQRASHVGV